MSRKNSVKRIRRLSMMLAMTTIFLTGCAEKEIEPPPPISDFCDLYVPICYDSRVDSNATINQILKNEVAFLKLCPKQYKEFKCLHSLLGH